MTVQLETLRRMPTKYEYAVYSSNGYFEDFRPFTTQEEAEKYFDEISERDGDSSEIILLKYVKINEKVYVDSMVTNIGCAEKEAE